MTSVASAIASLLYDHDTVIVPGLGAFVRQVESAHVNVITNEFQRPSSQLSFDPRQREENTLVIESLMASDGLTNDEARTAIATFVNDCFAHLKEEGAMPLPGLGTLARDEHQNLVFEPEDTNFNGDAFGLEDLNPEPVYGTENGDSPSRFNIPSAQGNALGSIEPVDPIEPIEPVKPTEPVNPIEPTPSPRRSLWWLWLLLLLLAAAGVALWYFQFRPGPTKPWPVPSLQRPERPQRLTTVTTDTLMVQEDTVKTAPVETPTETIVEPPIETPKPETPEVTPKETPTVTPTDSGTVKVITPEPTSKAFIVGGCFAVEQNALNMTTEAREQGCSDAFTMKRGSKYYVCYGQYPSNADAKTALPQILKDYNSKAWILTK